MMSFNLIRQMAPCLRFLCDFLINTGCCSKL